MAAWKDATAGQRLEVWVEEEGPVQGKGRSVKVKDLKLQGSWQSGVVKRVEGSGTRMKLYVTYKGVDGRETTEAIALKDSSRVRFGADIDAEDDTEGTQTKSARKSRKSKSIADDTSSVARTFEIGARVRVLFSDGAWYTGTVETVNVEEKQMEILFDDGDKDTWPLPEPGPEVQIIVPTEELADTIKNSLSQAMTAALKSWMKTSQQLSGKLPKTHADALNTVFTSCAKTIRSSKGSVNTEEAAADLLTSQARSKLVDETSLLTEAQWEEFKASLASADRRFDGSNKAVISGTSPTKKVKPDGMTDRWQGEGKYDMTARGTLCEIEFEKEWWLGTVMKHSNGRVHVLYAGSDEEYEWVRLHPDCIRPPQDDGYVPIDGFTGEKVHCLVEQGGKERWVEATVASVDKANGSVDVAYDLDIGVEATAYAIASAKIRKPTPEEEEEGEEGAEGAEEGEGAKTESEVVEKGPVVAEDVTASGKKGRGRAGRKDKDKDGGKATAKDEEGGGGKKGRGRKSKGGEEGVEKGGGKRGKEGDQGKEEEATEGGTGAGQESVAGKEGESDEGAAWIVGVMAGAVHELDVRLPQDDGRSRWVAAAVEETDEDGTQIRVRAGDTTTWVACTQDGQRAVRPASHVIAEGAALELKAAEGYKGEVLVLHGGCWLRGSLLGAATGKGSKKGAAKGDKESVKVVVTDKKGAQQRLTLPLCKGCLRSASAAATAPAVGEAVQVFVGAEGRRAAAWKEAVVKGVDFSACKVEVSIEGGKGEWVNGYRVRKTDQDQVGLLREMIPNEEGDGGEKAEGGQEGEDKMEVEEQAKEEGEGKGQETAGADGGEDKDADGQLGKRKRGQAETDPGHLGATAGPVAKYEKELRELQRAYNEGKESLKEDLESLFAEIKACHLRFHRATIGRTVAGIYRRNGVRCGSCRARIPGKAVMDEWRVGFTQCAKCGVQHERKRHCVVCSKVYMEVEDQMVQCSHCSQWVHGPCDGLDEISLAAFYQAGREGYLCPLHRGKGERGAVVGELRFIPIVSGIRQYGQPDGVFGLRMAPDGRVLYGLQYQRGAELEWRGGLGDDATVQRMALLFVLECFPGGTVLHPTSGDARDRARRWGEVVKASGGPKATLKVGGASLQDLKCLYVEAVEGIRRVPAEACRGVEASVSTPDVYVDMVRGGLSMWGRLPMRNGALQELTAGFLFAAVGVVSVFLPAAPRETLLKELRLWDAFCEGMGLAPSDPAASSR